MQNLKIYIGQDIITLGEDKNNISYSPSEAEKIVTLLSFAGSTQGHNLSIPHIQNTPFRIYFEKENLTLFKKGQKNDEGFKFSFKEIDSLIKIIRGTLDSFRDKHTLEKKKK